jgi:DNA polymerase/3'-5' exonuclease PolX
MKNKIPLLQARVIAERLITRLAPYCQRIEIAGSIRRCKPMVGDIEIVAIPYPARDLFGSESMEPHALDLIDWTEYGEYIKGKHKYKQILLPEGMALDLFLVTPPAQWGVIFLQRTGPDTYSHRFVTSKLQRGMMPSIYQVKDGAIWKGGRILETPEEEDVYQLIGAPWVEPQDRAQ